MVELITYHNRQECNPEVRQPPCRRQKVRPHTDINYDLNFDDGQIDFIKYGENCEMAFNLLKRKNEGWHSLSTFRRRKMITNTHREALQSPIPLSNLGDTWFEQHRNGAAKPESSCWNTWRTRRLRIFKKQWLHSTSSLTWCLQPLWSRLPWSVACRSGNQMWGSACESAPEEVRQDVRGGNLTTLGVHKAPKGWMQA